MGLTFASTVIMSGSGRTWNVSFQNRQAPVASIFESQDCRAQAALHLLAKWQMFASSVHHYYSREMAL